MCGANSDRKYGNFWKSRRCARLALLSAALCATIAARTAAGQAPQSSAPHADDSEEPEANPARPTVSMHGLDMRNSKFVPFVPALPPGAGGRRRGHLCRHPQAGHPPAPSLRFFRPRGGVPGSSGAGPGGARHQADPLPRGQNSPSWRRCWRRCATASRSPCSWS